MYAAEVVPREVQGHCRFQVRQLLANSVTAKLEEQSDQRRSNRLLSGSDGDCNYGVKPAEYHVGTPSLAMPRRRGNPKWGSGGQPVELAHAAATEFELQVRQLGLTKQTCASSTELRTWCERNRNRCYIPEWLLGVWGIAVNPTFGW
jgi:hypothetical protein